MALWHSRMSKYAYEEDIISSYAKSNVENCPAYEEPRTMAYARLGDGPKRVAGADALSGGLPDELDRTACQRPEGPGYRHLVHPEVLCHASCRCAREAPPVGERVVFQANALPSITASPTVSAETCCPPKSGGTPVPGQPTGRPLHFAVMGRCDPCQEDGRETSFAPRRCDCGARLRSRPCEPP